MNKYVATIKFTFECTYVYEAPDKHNAYEYAEKHCGAVGPSYQSTITDDFKGDVHASTKTIKIKKL